MILKRQTFQTAIKSVAIWTTILVSCSCSYQQEPSAFVPSSVSEVKADTLLNSERIRQKYGSYGVEVLYSDSTTRITSLYSLEGAGNITRTLAVVMYPTFVDSALFAEHGEILSGGSIGQVFKDAGWTIDKRSIYLGQLSPSEDYDEVYKLMGGIDETELAVYIYSFIVDNDGDNYDYATIAEVYHPDYLRVVDLRKLYSDANSGTAAALDLKALLDTVQRYLSLDMIPDAKLKE
jgi:hypothetical protein